MPTFAALSGLAVGVAMVLLWAAAPAHAIDPGVVYEPGSPAAKEYAIPLEAARRDAGSPGHEEKGGKPATYAAFGAGVGPPGSGGSSGSGRGDGARNGGAHSGERASGRVRAKPVDIADAEKAGGSTSWTLLILLAVALPGALLGFGLARLQRRPAT